MSIIDFLKEERKKAKISQVRMAKLLKISKSALSRIENKKRRTAVEFAEEYANIMGYELRVIKKL